MTTPFELTPADVSCIEEAFEAIAGSVTGDLVHDAAQITARDPKWAEAAISLLERLDAAEGRTRSSGGDFDWSTSSLRNMIARAAQNRCRPMTPKTPTPQGISALLKRARFPRAAGRGTHGFSAGKIYQGSGVVRVRYWFAAGGGTDAERRAHLERYAKVITAAGYIAELHDDGRKLLVFAKGEC